MKHKPTKRPKHVKIKWIKYNCVQSEYECPCCKTIFIGSVMSNTTRFICSCGQELIINK